MRIATLGWSIPGGATHYIATLGWAFRVPGPMTIRDVSDRVVFADASNRVTCRDLSDRVDSTIVS